MKAIIFDSGALITFSMIGNLDILVKLKKNFNGKFLITHEIEQEIVKKSMSIKKYKLGALRLKELIDEKILEFPNSAGINENQIQAITKKYLNSVNNIFFSGNEAIHLIDLGEASCLALTSLLTEKGVKSIIAIDERTTRIFFEKPENLHKLLESKLHTKLTHKEFIKDKFNFARSSELIYFAYKNKIIKQDKDLLDAMLYAAKFKGCSISSSEIKELESL